MASYEPKPANGGSYDQRLLDSAPSVTRAEKQEGYNVDLLEEGRRPTSPPAESPISEPQPRASQPSLRRERERAPLPVAPRRLPWYRRPAGIIGIIVVILIIIGAVVGGAVGGTRHHSNSSDASTSSSSADSGQQTLGSGPGGGSQATEIQATTTTTSDGGGSLGTGAANFQLGPAATSTPNSQLSAVGSLGDGP